MRDKSKVVSSFYATAVAVVEWCSSSSVLSLKHKKLLGGKEAIIRIIGLASDLCATCKAVSLTAHQDLNY